MGKCLKNKILRKQTFCLLILFFVAFASGVAQEKEKIRLVKANDLFGTERKGKEAQRLIGDVVFEHKNALMYCDSAYLYKSTNSLDAFGSVRINQGDTLNLYGDFLHYEGNTQQATVTGEVVTLESPDFTLVTDRLLYDREANIASYYTGATIESKNDSNILVSKRGFFYANQSLFTFKNDVVLTNPNFVMNSDTLRYFTNTEIVNFLGPTTIVGDSNLIYCENGWYDTRKDQSRYFENAYIISDGRKLEGDTLFYDRTIGYGQADGNIQVTDTAENILINGEHGRIFELKDSAIVTDNSLLTQAFEEDSLFMHADTFKVYETAIGERKLFAYYGVRIYKSDLQGVCDSIAYSMTDSSIQLISDPILWSENNQLTADTIVLRLANNKINSIFLDQNAFIIAEVSEKRFNQIKGKNMTGFFRDSKLRSINVRGNGQTTYFAQDEQDKFIGVNVAESTDINIRLGDDGIESITYLKKPKSKMHPMGELDPVTELRYKGFQWLIDLRPLSKEDLFVK